MVGVYFNMYLMNNVSITSTEDRNDHFLIEFEVKGCSHPHQITVGKEDIDRHTGVWSLDFDAYGDIVDLTPVFKHYIEHADLSGLKVVVGVDLPVFDRMTSIVCNDLRRRFDNAEKWMLDQYVTEAVNLRLPADFIKQLKDDLT